MCADGLRPLAADTATDAGEPHEALSRTDELADEGSFMTVARPTVPRNAVGRGPYGDNDEIGRMN